MICKLCNTKFTGSECTRCGLRPGENPIVWPLRTGDYAGWDIDRVFKTNPDYLRKMLQEGTGTGAQKALIRLLLEPPAPAPIQQTSIPQTQNTAYKVWVLMAAIFIIAIIALVIIR